MDLAQKVAERFARTLSDSEYTKLVAWLGPKALAAHRKYPRGLRSFDDDTRKFVFNIDPQDYFEIEPGVEYKRAPRPTGVIPEAYKAMQDVLTTLRARRIKHRVVKVSWEAGGSYIEALFPEKS